MQNTTKQDRQRQLDLAIQGRGIVAARRARLAKSNGRKG